MGAIRSGDVPFDRRSLTLRSHRRGAHHPGLGDPEGRTNQGAHRNRRIDILGLDLSESAAGRLPYDRSSITPEIAHLGVGALHRAHMAPEMDEVLRNDPSCKINGASLRRSATRDVLAPQGFLYTLTARSGSSTAACIVGSCLRSWTPPRSGGTDGCDGRTAYPDRLLQLPRKAIAMIRPPEKSTTPSVHPARPSSS